jgi:hypothetical protein
MTPDNGRTGRRGRSAIRRELDTQRADECRPLLRSLLDDEPFWCGLATLWCTEGHGPLAWQKWSDGPTREAGAGAPTFEGKGEAGEV